MSKKASLTTVELFAGAGGMAIGFEQAGFEHLLLNEFDSDACKTLRKNRPNWNVVEGDVSNLDFTYLAGKVDVLAGGFPCQAFSYAGKRLGFGDPRGTLFMEYARAVAEIRPKVALAENVRGLVNHDGGRTLATIQKTMADLGYYPIHSKILKAVEFGVPQKRERIILAWATEPYAELKIKRIGGSDNPRLRDALKAGSLYPVDVPPSPGINYSKAKAKVLAQVPPGGYWKDLPPGVAKAYMKGSWNLEGGRTGIARRISWDEPSLTVLTSPAQMQTDRCHPDEVRPFTVRESARIQTFPDAWEFEGAIGAQYRQIGNAVPVMLAEAIAVAIAAWIENIPGSKARKMSKSAKVLEMV